MTIDGRYYWETYEDYRKRVKKTIKDERIFWSTHITQRVLILRGWSKRDIEKKLKVSTTRKIKMFGKVVSYKIYKLKDVLDAESTHITQPR